MIYPEGIAFGRRMKNDKADNDRVMRKDTKNRLVGLVVSMSDY